MRNRLFLATSIILLSSCGGWDGLGLSNKSTREAKRYEIQKALDEGRYDFVINTLSGDPTWGGALSKEEGLMSLGAAYSGKAGIDFFSMIDAIIDSGGNTQAMTTFLQSMNINSSATNLISLKQSSQSYKAVADPCTPAPTDKLKRDACFYRGIIDIIRSAIGIEIVVGDLDKWLNPQGCQDDANQNNVGDSGEASGCAIAYAVNGTTSCSPTVTAAPDVNVTFQKNTNRYPLQLVKIDVSPSGSCLNTNTFYHFVTASPNGSALLTHGFCNDTFTPCNNLDPANGCYPCPVLDEDGNLVTVSGTIVDAINSAKDAIISTVASDDSTRQSIEDMVSEVCGIDNVCDENDISNFLQQ